MTAPAKASDSPTPPRVFMVEDDYYIMALVRDVLLGSGYEFVSADRLGGAMESLKRFDPDVVLLDVMLPDGEGFELCRKIRADPDVKDLPVIFLTTRTEIDSRLKGFGAGGNDYVAKPFAVPELVARLQAHLGAKLQRDKMMTALKEMTIRDRARQDMIDMVVHDLRAPVSTIKLTLQIVEAKGLITSDDYKHLIKIAEDAADFALLMVNDTIDLCSGKLNIDLKPIEPAFLEKRIGAMFADLTKGQQASLKMELPKTMPDTVSDPLVLCRVLVNLIGNAVKFSPQGGTVELKAYVDGANVRFEVLDRGPGIPDAEKWNIFKKYYRVQNAASKNTPGAGIGLAFCRLACETLGGRIWVEDRPGGGSRFLVEVPRQIRVPAGRMP